MRMNTETTGMNAGTDAVLRHSDITSSTLDSFYRAYNGLGYGFFESVYANALQLELESSGLRVEREVPVEVWYRGRSVGKYRADFVIDRCVVLELKAGHSIDATARMQLLNYLRCTDLEVGLLLHFGPRPGFHRIIHTKNAGRDDANPRSSRPFPRSSASPLFEPGRDDR